MFADPHRAAARSAELEPQPRVRRRRALLPRRLAGQARSERRDQHPDPSFPGLSLDGEPGWRDRLTIRGVDRLPLSLG